MGEFEVLERDGFARLGRLTTPHGPLETPALLPVIHPDPARQPVPPAEMRERFGFQAVISSAYITWKTPALRERGLREGIHGLLGFEGPVMTDSGAFQQHAYGHVDVGPEEILDFQGKIGTDIATVLDTFTEPEATEEEAAAGVRTTLARARDARGRRPGLLAVPVQGGLYPALREEAASEASLLGDVLAIGGVVPLMEQYRFPALAGILLAARPRLAPERVVHLFGTGHPMTFALAALFGVDLFDSSSYHKFARRGSLLLPTGTVHVESVREPICRCSLCERTPLHRLGELGENEREAHIARHNLLACAEEMARVRQAIRDGTLWELAEQRASGHPALAAALRTVVEGGAAFWPVEPVSRRSFRCLGPTSGGRPAVTRFAEHLARWREGKGPFVSRHRVSLTPGSLRSIPAEGETGVPLWWEFRTSLGPVPLELSELYPFGPLVGPDDYLPRPPATGAEPPPLPVGPRRDWTESWTARHVKGVLEWEFGRAAADALLGTALRAERSRRSGRLRLLRRGTDVLFVFGNDGVPRPTWRGGEALHATLAAPRLRVVMRDDAVPFVERGKSLFSAFVLRADPALVPDSSALLVDSNDRLLAVGRLLLAPHEMGRLPRGVAARVTAHARAPMPAEEEPVAPPIE